MMDLVRDVLDKQLVSSKGQDPLGMADGIVLELRDGEPPRVCAIETGFPVLARRIHPRLERWMRAIGRRIGIRRGRVARMAWSRIRSVGIDVKIDMDADTAPSTAWDRWLEKHVVRYIPGGKK